MGESVLQSDIPLLISEEVADALSENKSVVALESNVITHGLPYPLNIETAVRVEAAVRRGGSVPATVCVNNGKIAIGMTHEEMDQFANSRSIPKVSNRDLCAVLANRGKGATTVASTVLLAELANIDFFASAGIGGVHRGAEQTMDISADLIQFTRSKVAVICAGAKNILDLGLTLEYLETHGVPVISYQSDFFPAFYCKSSGFKAPLRIDDEELIANTIRCHWSLGLRNSLLVTKPIEHEHAIDEQAVKQILEKAIIDCRNENVSGSAITKYLMHAIDRETNGRTSKANMSVLISTAEFAGRLANIYAEQSSKVSIS
jgi:pseudouridine-5'-phosphate glycosidase